MRDSNARTTIPDPVDLEQVEGLHERGRFLSAYGLLRGEGRSRRLTGNRELALAVRVCSNLDLGTEAAGWHRVLWRRDPSDPEARRQRVQHLVNRGRFVDALELAMQPPAEDLSPRELVRWQSTCCNAFSRVRDFARAEAAIEAARKVDPDSAWLANDLAWLRFQQDRLPEALERVRDAVSRNADDFHAHYLLGVLLHETNEVEECTGLFEAMRARFEAPVVHTDLFDWLVEAGDHERAVGILEEGLARYPRPRRFAWRALATRLSRAHYLAGNRARAIELARELSDEQRWIQEALERDDPDGRRVVLDVPYIRQDHLSCGPASLAMVLAFFGHRVDQRDVADEITYDGTPDHAQRDWCRRHGLKVRHFQFEEAAARRLIDRGIPFALVTHAPMNSHMQAVVGYDTVLGTWLLREPGAHALQEIKESALIERGAARGAMAIVVLPPASFDLDPPGALPFEEECEASVQLHAELENNRLEEAARCLEIVRRAPAGPLVWDAERQDAAVRQDRDALLVASRAQYAAAPKDEFCREVMARDLTRAGRWAELQEFLESLEENGDAPPTLSLHLVDLWRRRSSSIDRARRLARRTCRVLSGFGRAFSVLGHVHWIEPRERPRALLCYRTASCVDPLEENHALAYFDACRKLGELEQGLAYLEERSLRHREKSALPTATYAEALRRVYRVDDSLEVLREARRHHGDSWTRALFVDRLLEAGREEEAELVLDEEGDQLRPLDRVMLRHRQLLQQGRREEALEHLESAAPQHPGESELQDRRLQLIAEFRGQEVAANEALCLLEARPDDLPFLALVCRAHQRLGDLETVERLLRERLDRFPDSFGTRSLLAQLLLDTGRPEDSLHESEEIVRRSTHGPAGWIDLGRARAATGDRAGAWEAFRRSLELDVNRGEAMYWMAQQAESHAQAEEGLEFLADQLRLQGPQEDGLGTYCDLARGTLRVEGLQARLRELEADFAGEPEPGEALVELFLAERDWEAARRQAERCVELFPWRVSGHLLLAQCKRALRDLEGARETLLALIERDPSCSQARVRLGELLEEEGELEEAESAYREGLRFAPEEGILLGYLADLQHRRGKADEALETLRRSLQVLPDYGWAMEAEIRWLQELGRLEEAFDRAKYFTRVQAQLASAYEVLAQACRPLGRHDEMIEAMRRALECDPRLGETRGMLMATLAEMGRFDDARAVLAEGRELLGDESPLTLQEALLVRREGRFAAAVELLEGLLDREPEFLAGWGTLLGWWQHDRRSRDILALESEPPECLVGVSGFWLFVGEAHLAGNDHESARRALHRARELDPHDERPRSRLAQSYEDTAALDELAALFRADEDPDALPSEAASLLARAAAQRRDTEQFVRCLLRIFRDPEVMADSLQRLAAAWRALPGEHRERAHHELLARAEGKAARAALAAALGEEPELMRGLDELVARGDEGHTLLERVLRVARGTQARARTAEWCLKTLPPPISDLPLRCQISTLLADDHPAALIPYFEGDWRHPDIPPWALANYAIALRHVGRDEELRMVCEYAIELPRTNALWYHRTMLAYVSYRRGDLALCCELCEVPDNSVATPRFEGVLLRLLVDLREKKAASARLRAGLREALEAAPGVTFDGGRPYGDRFWRFACHELRRLALGPSVLLFTGGRVGRALLRRLLRADRESARR